MLNKTCTTYKIGKESQARQVKSKRTNEAKARRFTHHRAENQTVRVPLRQEPNGLHTITPRNKRFAYHRAKPPVLQYVVRELTLSVGTQMAMPEAQSTWTKRVGAEPKQQNKHKRSNEVSESKRWQCTNDANPTVC